MTINFVCSCGRKLKASDEQAGVTGSCPRCGNPVTAPLLIYHEHPKLEAPPPRPAAEPKPSAKRVLQEPEIVSSPFPPPEPIQTAIVPRKTDYRPLIWSAAGVGTLAVLGILVAVFSGGTSGATANATSATARVGTPKIKPSFKITENFRAQLMSYLKTAGKLSALSSQGVHMNDFEKQLAEVRSELELLEHTWTKEIKEVGLPSFQASLSGYDYARKLWQMRLDRKGVPMEPDINSYREFLSVGGKYLDINTYQRDDPNPDLREKNYIPFDPNIGIFLAMGSKLFDIGRNEIIELIK